MKHSGFPVFRTAPPFPDALQRVFLPTRRMDYVPLSRYRRRRGKETSFLFPILCCCCFRVSPPTYRFGRLEYRVDSSSLSFSTLLQRYRCSLCYRIVVGHSYDYPAMMTPRTAEYQTSRVSNIFRIEIDLTEHYRENTENLINTVRFSWMPRVIWLHGVQG